MSVSDSPIWSFQKSVMIGIGNSTNWIAANAVRSRTFLKPAAPVHRKTESLCGKDGGERR